MDGGTQYLTPGQVARTLGVSPRTIDRWADMGRIPCIITLGGHRRFSRDAVAGLAQAMGIVQQVLRDGSLTSPGDQSAAAGPSQEA